MYVQFIPGKKSASWQLVAVIKRRKSTQKSGEKRRKIAITQSKLKDKEFNFLIAVVFEFFRGMMYVNHPYV